VAAGARMNRFDTDLLHALGDLDDALAVLDGEFLVALNAPMQALLPGDAGGLAVDAAFLLEECKERRGIVSCRSTDRRYNLRAKPFRPREGTGKQIVTIALNGLDIGPSFQAPVTVQLRHGAGIVRTGSIATCKTAPGALRCFP